MLVYLADLRHKTITLTPDAMPLGIGFLAAYSSMALGPEVEFKLFADADLLIDELKSNPPAVLGVTNYVWNYALHSRVLRYAKETNPDILTLMGGPNIPADSAGEESRLKDTPGLDIYVINEGEQALVDILKRYMDSGFDKNKLLGAPLPSSIFIDLASGEVVRGAPHQRMRSLDEIPSPFLTGLMDPFFDGKFTPMIQTNRGCPFTCSFCVEGVSYMTKVNKFDSERIQDELNYISDRVEIGSALMVSDSNFGMLPGDLATAQHIRKIQQEKGWPRFVWATTGKNNKEGVLTAIELLEGTMIMGNSVQSMDPVVLENIRRTNIKLETYDAILKEVTERNLQSYAEVIIGLPGETKDSFYRGVSHLLDSGAQRVCAYQLMLLDGTDLSNQTSREKFGFNTKYRLLSRNFGSYAGEPVFEMEEIVVSTNTFSFEDYMEARKLQLLVEVYHREELFRELLEYLRTRNVPISQYMFSLLESLSEAPHGASEVFTEYMKEAQEELFDSPELVREAMTADYSRLLDQEAGGNLIQKYSAVAWFNKLDATLDYGIQIARSLVLAQNSENPSYASVINGELDSIRKYLLAKTINLMDFSEGAEGLTVDLEYDIESWRAQGYGKPLAEFQHHSNDAEIRSIPYRFYVSDDHAAYLRNAIQSHGVSSQALGKLMSRLAIQDLRRSVEILGKNDQDPKVALV